MTYRVRIIPGGIDLTPENLNLETEGSGVNFDIPFDPAMLEGAPITGFRPIIFQIVPVTDLQLLLGDRKERDALLDENEPEVATL